MGYSLRKIAMKTKQRYQTTSSASPFLLKPHSLHHFLWPRTPTISYSHPVAPMVPNIKTYQKNTWHRGGKDPFRMKCLKSRNLVNLTSRLIFRIREGVVFTFTIKSDVTSFFKPLIPGFWRIFSSFSGMEDFLSMPSRRSGHGRVFCWTPTMLFFGTVKRCETIDWPDQWQQKTKSIQTN